MEIASDTITSTTTLLSVKVVCRISAYQSGWSVLYLCVYWVRGHVRIGLFESEYRCCYAWICFIVLYTTLVTHLYMCVCACEREGYNMSFFLSVLHACAHMSLCVFLHHVCCKSHDPLGTALGGWLLKIVVLFLVQTLWDLVAHTKHHLLCLLYFCIQDLHVFLCLVPTV